LSIDLSDVIALFALFVSVVGVVYAVLAHSAAAEANDIAKAAAKTMEELERKALRAEHELQEFQTNFSQPLATLLFELESAIDELDHIRKFSGAEKAIRAFEKESWERAHRKLKMFLVSGVAAKFITEETLEEILRGPGNSIDPIFEALDELARDGNSGERSIRAFEKFKKAAKSLSKRLSDEKELARTRLYIKLGVN
jgi:hypothetical protein